MSSFYKFCTTLKLKYWWENYVLAKILQNEAKIIKKLTPGFKNRMKNLGSFRQAVQIQKSWNLMSHFCPKNTFFQLNHYIQRIYLILLSITCVKIHQIFYVIIETNSPFERQNPSAFFKLKHCILSTKDAHKVQIFHCNTFHCSG